MSATAAHPPHVRRGRARSRILGAVVAGALAGGVLGPAAVPGHAARAAVTSDVTMIQANILSQLSVEKFQADVRKVLAERPDVVTYNEVPLRQDSVLAPSGYAVHRGMKNRYTKATAVAWRTDRWTEVASGTRRVSNYREVPRGRNIKLGLRFVNWVTLRSADGRQMSVVAAHVAPPVRDMPDLLRPTVRRIGSLVEELAASGPVLVGGDFNVHYRSGRYPRDLLEAAGMVPTYDALGSYFPTGDHRGATIDYVFSRGEDLLGIDQHSRFEMNSDHDAVVAGLSWLADAPGSTQRIVSDPSGDRDSQRRVLAALGSELRALEPGSEVDVVTSGFGPHRLYRRVRGAAARGVEVRLTTRSAVLTGREQKLAQFLEEEGVAGSEVRHCRSTCLRAWRRSGMARSFLLFRDSGGRAETRMDVNRFLSPSMLDRRTRLVVRTGAVELAKGEEMLDSLS